MADTAPQLTSQPAPTGGLLARPRLIAIGCVVALAALGWIYLGVMVAGMSGEGIGRAVIEALCRPEFGSSAGDARDVVLVFLMWCAMALAMMVPTAGPMILTYAELAETASAKGERIVSPAVLTAGYASVWLGFAIVATALQVMLTRAALLDPTMSAVSPLFSGAIFIGAGAYQFSALKEACVTRCQRPFPFFFANWSTEARKIFRHGLTQGLYCLGCCWAMMMLMFAVRAMNVLWMAALGTVMAAEKVATTMRFSRIVGVVLLGIGVVLIGSAVITHWPRAA